MVFALVILVLGLVTIVWIYLWSQQTRPELLQDTGRLLEHVPGASSKDAVLVAREQGQLVHVNAVARRWLGSNGDEPDLESLARLAQPVDNFLELFSREAQTSFQMGERWIEASSHRVAVSGDGHGVFVIVMREMNGSSGAAQSDVLDMGLAMRVINEIGETVNVRMGIESVLQTLLAIVLKAIPAEAGEVCLWDEREKVLRQRGWVGNMAYMLSLEEQGGVYAPGEGISGWIAEQRQPVLVGSLQNPVAIQPKVGGMSYRSFVGIPLLLNGRFVGTFELADSKPDHFNQAHVALLQAVRMQVAISIHNAELYAEQMQRVDDMASLQQTASYLAGTAQAQKIYAALTERIAALMGTELCGILLVNEERGTLEAVTPFHGLPDRLAQSIVVQLKPDTPQYDIWHNQQYWVSNDIDDERLIAHMGLVQIVNLAALTNVLLMPMWIGGERIGALLVCNKQGSFSAQDSQNLRVLSAQAAIVVENLRLYERERRLDDELLGLQEITHAIGALSHTRDFFREITERIGRLMKVEMCGILLYEEHANRLAAHVPFYGVDDDLLETYHIDLLPDSAPLRLWETEDTWYTNHVSTDPVIFEANIYSVTEALGLRKMLLAVLSAAGKRIGMVQVANKLNDDDFTENDARLLLIFATQAAAMMENARLFQQVQRSAEEADSLRRVAQLAGGVLTPDSLKTVLFEIADLMDSPITFISVLNEAETELQLLPRYVYGRDMTEPVIYRHTDGGFDQTVTISGTAYIGNKVPDDPRVLPGYRPIAQQFKIQRAVLVPLTLGGQRLGELGVANRHHDYDKNDLRQLGALGAQIAGAIERLRLYGQTERELARRLQELDAISHISSQLTVTYALEPVMQIIREQVTLATGADYCTIVLLRPSDHWVYPDRPEADQRIGDADQIGLGLAQIERQAVLRGADPVLVSNYAESDLKALPERAASAIAASFFYVDQIVGIIHLYHSQPNRFDDRSAAFLATAATAAALGFGTYIRHTEEFERSVGLRRRVEQLNQIFELGQMLQTNVDQPTMLEAFAYAVQTSAGYDTVVILMVDKDTQTLYRTAHAGLPVEVFEQTRRHRIALERFNRLRATSGYNIPMSESYFFPVEEAPRWYSDDLMALNTRFDGNRTLPLGISEAWRDGDMLLVLLVGSSGGELLGVMSLDRPQDNRRPDRQTIEILEILAHQAAQAIENQRLYHALARGAEQESRLNQMMEAVASTLDIEEIINAVAENAMYLVPFMRMTASVLDSEGQAFDLFTLRLDPHGGFTTYRDRDAALDGTALERTYLEGIDYLYRAGDPDVATYQDLTELHERGEQMSLVVPLLAGGMIVGAIHFGSDLKNAYGFEEYRPLLRRMAQLAGVALQNARLFQQAVDLQVLNQSVIESIQQGIVVLDNNSTVLSINDYVVHRYGWSDDVKHQNLFKQRPDFATFLKADVDQVLETGKPAQRLAYESTDVDGTSYVRNFYIYPLLAAEGIRGVVLLIEDVTESTRLEQAVQARAQQLAALAEVSSRITSSLERKEVVSLALDEMERVIAYDVMTLWRREGAYMTLEGARGENVAEYAPGFQVEIGTHDRISRVLSRKGLFSIATLRGIDPLPGEQGMQSWLGIPLMNQQNVVGLIALNKQEAAFYDALQSEQAALAFANQVAVALANADLFQQTFARRHELETLLEAAQTTALVMDLDQVFRTVVELMLNTIHMDTCTVMIWDEVENALDVAVDMNRYGDETRIKPKGFRYPLAEYPVKLQVLQSRRLAVVRYNDESAHASEREELLANEDSVRMLVPLVLRDQAMGLIQLEQAMAMGTSVSEQQMRLAQALGAQVAVAIENARLASETAARVEESMLINELSHAISSTIDIDGILDVVRKQLPRVVAAEEMYIALYDEMTEQVSFPVAVRQDGTEFAIPPRALGDDEVSYIIRGKRALTLGGDYFNADDVRHSLHITNSEGDCKSYLGVPLVARDSVVGTLAVRDLSSSRVFGVNDQRVLQTIGGQLAVAIQNALLIERISGFNEDLNRQVQERTEELQQERDRIDTLYQITSELARTLDMNRVLDRALGMVAKATGADDGTILLANPITDQLYSSANLAYTPPPGADGEPGRHPAEELAMWLMDNDHDVVVDDLEEVDYWDWDVPGAEQFGSALAVLLETNEEVQGVMVLLKKRKSGFTEDHLRLVVAAANQVASTINNADLYQLIREQTEKLGTLLRAEQEEAEKNAAILESIADGVIVAQPDGVVVQLNSAAERILDQPREQVVGREMTGLVGAQLLRDWTDNPAARSEDFIEDQLTLGDRIVSVHQSPVYIGEKFLGTVSVFRDITRDVELDRMKSEFISSVSHEFRTPLTPIKGYVDLLLVGATGALTDQQRGILNTIKDNVDRLTLLVNDVLEISKVDSGKEELYIEPVRLGEVIPEVVNRLLTRQEHMSKAFDVVLDVEERLPDIDADRKKLVQIITNLVDNAFSYTHAGGRIEVAAGLQPQDSRNVLIRISDTGVGIPPEYRDRVWLRFQRYEEHALEMEVAGTGLGLPIVKELVALHNGKIWFESQLDVGTTFYVTLPIEQPAHLKTRHEYAVTTTTNGVQ